MVKIKKKRVKLTSVSLFRKKTNNIWKTLPVSIVVEGRKYRLCPKANQDFIDCYLLGKVIDFILDTMKIDKVEYL